MPHARARLGRSSGLKQSRRLFAPAQGVAGALGDSWDLLEPPGASWPPTWFAEWEREGMDAICFSALSMPGYPFAIKPALALRLRKNAKERSCQRLDRQLPSPELLFLS